MVNLMVGLMSVRLLLLCAVVFRVGVLWLLCEELGEGLRAWRCQGDLWVCHEAYLLV